MKMKKLDAKFDGVVIKAKDGTIVPPDQYMVFLAKDDAVPETLRFYEGECARQGAAREQVEAVHDMRMRVLAWRKANPELCKTPDVDPGELLL